jgi:NAD(P)-dependent dehydrogenase (short-subunit alcohol dehydrogenase family)
MDFDGKVVVVSGAGSGIGRSTAKLFAEAGARLVLLDWHEADLQTVCDELRAGRAEVHPVVGDAADPAVAGQVARVAAEGCGGVDILCNNAAIDLPTAQSVTETSDADWHRTISANLTSVFVMSRAILPLMMAGDGGAVVNTGSTAGLVGVRAEAAYGAAKGGVISLTRQMAVDYAPGIRVNALCPGMVERPMRDRRRALDAAALARREQVAQARPLGRYVSHDEIARGIAFLAGSDAAFVTGTCLIYDGGWTAT